MEVIHRVAAEFHVLPTEIHGSSQDRRITQARHAWVYLLTQTVPRPSRYPSRGGTRSAGDQDGVVRKVAAMIGRQPSYVRYALHQTEDRRDDPEFDATLSKLERKLL